MDNHYCESKLCQYKNSPLIKTSWLFVTRYNQWLQQSVVVVVRKEMTTSAHQYFCSRTNLNFNFKSLLRP